VKPQFSPDGTKILFSCGTYGQAFNEDLCVMNADGSGVVDITNTPGVLENFPSWGTAPLE
jgi:Tol biopolymer transport system component